MYVDASAIIAILTFEPEKPSLSAKMDIATNIMTSSISIYEAVLGVDRKKACGIVAARDTVRQFLSTAKAETITIDATIGDLALTAFQTFGKGRHKAALNMGDCFAYACAKSRNVPLLFKGDDFGHTDIAVA